MACRLVLRRFFANVKNPLVFVDIETPEQDLGRMVFELRRDIVPKTTENFLKLCIGGSGKTTNGLDMWYKGTPVTRILPAYYLQGGDITQGDGTGGESVFGAKFDDENFLLKHDSRGILSMANEGQNTNGSQFFVTFAPCPWLDGLHVVFGKLVMGRDVLNNLETLGTTSGSTIEKVMVVNCGVVETAEEDK